MAQPVPQCAKSDDQHAIGQHVENGIQRILLVGSEKASEIAGNATLTEKSSGAIEAPNPMMTNAMMFKRTCRNKKVFCIIKHQYY